MHVKCRPRPCHRPGGIRAQGLEAHCGTQPTPSSPTYDSPAPPPSSQHHDGPPAPSAPKYVNYIGEGVVVADVSRKHHIRHADHFRWRVHRRAIPTPAPATSGRPPRRGGSPGPTAVSCEVIHLWRQPCRLSRADPTHHLHDRVRHSAGDIEAARGVAATDEASAGEQQRGPVSVSVTRATTSARWPDARSSRTAST